MVSSSLGNDTRWFLCGILFVTLVVQQARNVILSLRTNSADPTGPRLQNDKTPLELPSSSWMGNYWIPPPDQPLYSGLEFQQSFPPQQSVLMIGDDWLQHSYAMLHAILNNTDQPANVRVITLQETVEYALNNQMARCNQPSWTHCWGLPSLMSSNTPYSFDFVKVDCLRQAVSVLESDDLHFEKYKMIILGVGTGCSETTEINTFSGLRTRLLHLVSTHNNVTIVWRTTPNLVEAVQRGSGWEAVLTESHAELNDAMRQTVQGVPMTILDWAATLAPKARIRPLPVPQNLVPPTSQAAQLALLQQLLHSMVINNVSDGPITRQIEIR